MQSTFDTIAPRGIVDACDDGLRNEMSKADLLSMLWEKMRRCEGTSASLPSRNPIIAQTFRAFHDVLVFRILQVAAERLR
jgi:hypothetical protein